MTFNSVSRREIHHFVGVRVEDAAHHGRVLLAALLLEVLAEETLAAGLPEAVVGPDQGIVTRVTRPVDIIEYNDPIETTLVPDQVIITVLQDCDRLIARAASSYLLYATRALLTLLCQMLLKEE